MIPNVTGGPVITTNHKSDGILICPPMTADNQLVVWSRTSTRPRLPGSHTGKCFWVGDMK
jgi:hypothetical protein